MKKHNLLYIISILLFGACSDFLDESSQDLLIPKTVQNYKEFLYGEGLNNKLILCDYLDVMTDDAEEYINLKRLDREDKRARFWSYYSWQQYPELQMNNALMEDQAWGEYYHRIFVANVILDNLNSMEGSGKEKADLAGEAYFLRAWSYFMLANLYGKPYINEEQAAIDFCVPINSATGIEDRLLSRSSVKAVSDLMEADIKRSIASFREAEMEKMIFRPNLSTSYLLACRIALFRKDYDRTIAYADSVIMTTNAELFDMNGSYSNQRFMSIKNGEILFTYGNLSTQSQAFLYGSSYAASFIPSGELMNLYPATDKRKTTNLFFDNTKKKPLKFYGASSDGVYAYAFRLSEAYLNRAEAYANKGNIENAMRDVNAIREKRISGDYTLSATTAAQALNYVKEERRMEFCFEGFRWFDLRRWDRPEIVHRYTSVENPSNYTEYVLRRDDPAYTLPIPQKERDMNLSIEQIDRPQRRK